jgi:lipoprotein-anchoring transpeptidase ErfK/SrfK
VAVAQTNSGDERRRAKRIDTDYSVVFSDYRAIGPLREGRVTDQSTGGFRIVTTNPEKLGASLQLEIQQPIEKGGGKLLFEGRVAHVSQLESGEYAMGIRLLRRQLGGLVSPKDSVTAGASPATPAPSAASIGAINVRRVSPVTSQVASSVSPTATPPPSETPNVTFRKIQRRRRAGSWGAFAAVVALVIILLLLIAQAVNDKRGQQAAAPGAGLIFAPEPEQVDEETGKTEASGPITAESASDIKYALVDSAALDRVRNNADTLAALGIAADEIDLAELHGEPLALSVDRFIARLRYAADASARGERGLAMAVIRRALSEAKDVPGVWRDQAHAMLAALQRGNAVQEDAFPTEPIPMTAASGAAVFNAPVAIDVDASEHVMRVLRDGRVVATFPVGLGQSGATPRGTFRIGNKISDPDWYNDGQIVQAGAPSNPLGRQWFGLADASGPLSYGIHPTTDARSIGGDESRGCVRMRPDDAETLFRVIPIGTPVTIHD